MLGGFVESEKNLSHDGDYWVAEDARIYESVRVDYKIDDGNVNK